MSTTKQKRNFQYLTKEERKQIYLSLVDKVDEYVDFGFAHKRYTCFKLLKIAGFTGNEYDNFENYRFASRFPEFSKAMKSIIERRLSYGISGSQIFLPHEERANALIMAAELCNQTNQI